VPLREGRTLHHDVNGRHGAGRVVLRAAPAGTGIIAGGPMRAVFESLGMHDVVAKSIGTSNPYNMVRATFDALKREYSPRSVAARRGKKVSDIMGRRREGEPEPARAGCRGWEPWQKQRAARPSRWSRSEARSGARRTSAPP
jgi:small subunit ribosomal protein S5